MITESYFSPIVWVQCDDDGVVEVSIDWSESYQYTFDPAVSHVDPIAVNGTETPESKVATDFMDALQSAGRLPTVIYRREMTS